MTELWVQKITLKAKHMQAVAYRKLTLFKTLQPLRRRLTGDNKE